MAHERNQTTQESRHESRGTSRLCDAIIPQETTRDTGHQDRTVVVIESQHPSCLCVMHHMKLHHTLYTVHTPSLTRWLHRIATTSQHPSCHRRVTTNPDGYYSCPQLLFKAHYTVPIPFVMHHTRLHRTASHHATPRHATMAHESNTGLDHRCQPHRSSLRHSCHTKLLRWA